MPALEQLSQLIDAKFPPRHPAFLPGSAFFTKSVALPPEVLDADLQGFAELSLEEHSPFPIEQLRWGFLVDRPRGQIYLYASVERRLRSLGHEDLAPALHALPDFLVALAGPAPAKAEIRLICSGNELSAVALEAGAVSPTFVRSASVPQPDKEVPPTQAAIRETASALLRRLPDSPHALPATVTVLHSASTDDAGLIQVEVVEIALVGIESATLTPKTIPLSFSQPTLWQADIRDRDFLKTEQSSRQRSDIFWKAILVSLIVIGVLIFSQIGLWTSRHILTRRGETIAEQDKHVAKIQAKDNLLDKLRKATQEELKVFTMISAVIGERPLSISYKKVVAESGNLVIEGSTKQVVTFNKYHDYIKKLPAVESVTVPNITTQNNTEAPFMMTIKFKPGEPKEIKKDAHTEDPSKAPKDPTLDKKEDKEGEETPAVPAPTEPVPETIPADPSE